MRRFLSKLVRDKRVTMMRQLILSVAAVTLSVAPAATAEAAQKGGAPKGNASSHNGSRDYHLTHGTKFKGGYFYKGKEHRHWTYRYWYGKYGCYTYWCPSTSCWYYYYPREERYYPVSYIATATPVAATAPVDVSKKVTQIVNVT